MATTVRTCPWNEEGGTASEWDRDGIDNRNNIDYVLQKKGLFLCQAGTFLPIKNPYVWSNPADIIYIEEKIGAGFTQGKPDIDDEVELGQIAATTLCAFNIVKNLLLTGKYFQGVVTDYCFSMCFPSILFYVRPDRPIHSSHADGWILDSSIHVMVKEEELLSGPLTDIS